MSDPVVVTGAAGFIGFNTAKRLLERGERVIGIDNLNDYYDVNLKHARLKQLELFGDAFTFYKADVSDRVAMEEIFKKHDDVTRIIHLAAQAGVRYSIENPYTYIEANVMGQVVLSEICKTLKNGCTHFVYASSSSVYGANKKIPFSADDPVERPMAVYAASKRAAELLSHAYAHLFKIPSTGLRFFTVYGPWGRPDMAAYLFAKAIMDGKPINVFNHGNMRRDFTFIDDIVSGVIATLDHPPKAGDDDLIDDVPFRLLNLGNSQTERLMDYIGEIEKALGKTAEKNMLPMQPGDVPETFADIEKSKRLIGFEPTTPISVGIPKFIEWFKSYHNIKDDQKAVNQ